ncbi:MAG: Flp pilus assembly protein CpaB [Acidobacteriota bacterium]
MNFKRMAIALAIGLFISGSCTYLLSRTMKARAVVKTPELMYVAPTQPLGAGETLKAENLEMVKWPAGQPISDAFTKSELIVGRSLLYPVSKDQPITEQFLTAPGSGPGLAGEIPNGMRAIALKSDEVVGVAGFIMPGSHVDVLATVRADGLNGISTTNNDTQPVTFSVLQNAMVLATGHQVQPDPEGKPVSVNVVTLLLSPEDAQKAVLASLQGTIHFILRGGSDKEHSTNPPMELAQLVDPTSKPLVHTVVHHATAPGKPAAPPTIAVQTISGDKTTTDTFRMGMR